jgi:hypothetical protein
VAAGGALTGTYPDPSLAIGAVDGDAIANGTITLAGIDLDSFVAVIGATSVPAGTCVTAVPTIPSTPPVALDGSVVVQKFVEFEDPLPNGLFLPVYTTANGALVARVCNETAGRWRCR